MPVCPARRLTARPSLASSGSVCCIGLMALMASHSREKHVVELTLGVC
jgi:hypothetical protein